MKRITLMLVMSVLSLLAIAQNEYHFTLPEVQQTFRALKSLHLIIETQDQSADIRYEWVDVGLSQTFIVRSSNQLNNSSSYGGTIIAPGTITRVRLRRPSLESQNNGCTATPGWPYVYSDESTPNFDQISTGILRVYSVGGEEFKAYFEMAHGSYDDIFSLKGDASIANLNDTVVFPGQNFFDTNHDPYWVPSCHTPNYQAAYIGNVGSTTSTVQVYPNAAGVRYNGINYTSAASNFSITIPAGRTAVVYSQGTDNLDNIGGTYMRVTAGGSIKTTFEDAMLEINNSGLDPAGDEVPTNEFLDKKYFFRTGVGTFHEFVMIYPTVNGTTFEVRSQSGTSAQTFSNIDLGEGIRVDLGTNTSYMICSDKDVLVYQSSGFDGEVGTAVVPGFGCNGSRQTFLASPEQHTAASQLFITLMTVEPFHNNFKVEVSPLANPIGSFSSYHFESDVWTDITGQLTFPWQQHTNVGSTGATDFVSAKVEFPFGSVPANHGIRVTNSKGVYHMGMTYNAGGSAIKFGYLSDFDTLEVDTCLIMDNDFCQYQDIIFEVCTDFQYTHHNVMVLDEFGEIVGQTGVLEYPDNTTIFDIRDEVSSFPPLGSTGCYELNHIVYHVTEMCGEADTCFQDTLFNDFCIVTDLGDIWNDTVVEYVCDWSGLWNPNPNSDCVNFSCTGGNIEKSHVETTGNTPAWIMPTSGVWDEGTGVWCLTAGVYELHCYDTAQCRNIITPIKVIPQAPDGIMAEPIIDYVCDWSGTGNQFPNDNCATVTSCSGPGISHSWVEDFGQFGAWYNGTIGANGLTTWCLEPGDYMMNCYDTINCLIIQTPIHIIADLPSTIVNDTALEVCDWTGIFNPNNPDDCATIGGCTGPGISFSQIISAGSTPAMYMPVSGDMFDPFNNPPTWCLPIGNYVRECFDTLNCVIIQTNIEVVYVAPLIERDTIDIPLCDWSGYDYNNPLFNCMQVNMCNGVGVTNSTMSSIGSFPVMFAPIIGDANDPSTNPTWCLEIGSYKQTCFFGDDCHIKEWYINIVPDIPTLIEDVDTFELCDWAQAIFPVVANPACITIPSCGEAMNLYDLSGFFIVPTGNVGNSPVWCVGIGEYIRECYNPFDCEVTRTRISVDAEQPTIITSTVTEPICDWSATDYPVFDPPYKAISGCAFSGVAVSFIRTTGLFPVLIPPTNGDIFNPDSELEWYLTPGVYERVCYDADDCRTYIQTINVTLDPADIINQVDTFYVCEDECVEFWAGCDTPVLDYTTVETLGQFPAMVPPVHSGPFKVSKWCLEPGSYLAKCYLIPHCSVIEREIYVLIQPETIVSTVYDTVQVCEGTTVQPKNEFTCNGGSPLNSEWFFEDGTPMGFGFFTVTGETTIRGLNKIDGCTYCEMFITYEIADSMQGQTYEIDTCASIVEIGRKLGAGGSNRTLTYPDGSTAVNDTGYFFVPGPSAGETLTYTITTIWGEDCYVVDTYILSCQCAYDGTDYYESFEIMVEDTNTVYQFEVNPCPEGCNGSRLVYAYDWILGETVTLDPSVFDENNPNLLDLTGRYLNVRISCFDENGCNCYYAIYNLRYPNFPPEYGYFVNKQEPENGQLELLEELEVSLFPNPASSTFQLKLDGEVNEIDLVRIFSIDGKLVRTYNKVSDQKVFDLSDTSNGVYIVEISVGAETFKKKLVVQK